MTFLVEVQNVSPFWNGKKGLLTDHIIDEWYNVLVGETRLVLYPHEFKLLEGCPN